MLVHEVAYRLEPVNTLGWWVSLGSWGIPSVDY